MKDYQDGHFFWKENQCNLPGRSKAFAEFAFRRYFQIHTSQRDGKRFEDWECRQMLTLSQYETYTSTLPKEESDVGWSRSRINGTILQEIFQITTGDCILVFSALYLEKISVIK